MQNDGREGEQIGFEGESGKFKKRLAKAHLDIQAVKCVLEVER